MNCGGFIQSYPEFAIEMIVYRSTPYLPRWGDVINC